jgi:ferric-chelate reductase
VHYTRAPLGKLPFKSNPGLTLSPGRPRIAKVLDAAISRAVSLGAGAKDSERITGLLVAVCGPVGLCDDVAKAVGFVEPSRRDQVGGIEIHEEYVFAVFFFFHSG